MFLDPPRLLPPLLPHLGRNLGDCLSPRAVEARPRSTQRLTELDILHRRLGCGHELPRDDLCHD